MNGLKNRPSHLLRNQGAEDTCGQVTRRLELEEGTETTYKAEEADGVWKPLLLELLRADAVEQCQILDRTGHQLQHSLDLGDGGSRS